MVSTSSSIKYINDHSYDKFVPVLLVLAGIYRAFDRALEKDMGNDLSLIAVLSLSIIFGGLLGWIVYYIYAALISLTGEWLGGKANTKGILNMLAYGMIPTAIALFLFFLLIILFGNDVFKTEFDEQFINFSDNIVFSLLIVLQLIFTIYSIVLCVIGLSVIQNFSIGKAILNFILPILFLLIPFLIFAILFR